MSNGGRIGFDAPYLSRGCDMQWFTSEEVCEILARFDRVVLIGDSMMRHVMGAISILIRKDIGYGAVTDWNFTPKEKYDSLDSWQSVTDLKVGRSAFATTSFILSLALCRVSTRLVM